MENKITTTDKIEYKMNVKVIMMDASDFFILEN
jgi:hypothetical protein